MVGANRYQTAIAIFTFAIWHARISPPYWSGGDFNPYRASGTLEREKKDTKRTLRGKVTTVAFSMIDSHFQSY